VEAETCKRELVIEIPREDMRKESESIAAQFARKAHFPGFRPGRVPRELILRRYGVAIREEAAESLVPKFFQGAVKAQNLSVAGKPKFENLDSEETKPLVYRASFEVYPAFELGEYNSIEVSVDEPLVADTEVEQAIEKLRQEAATFEVVEGDGAQEGDLLSVSYQGRESKPSGRVVVAMKEGKVRLGAQGTLREFSEGLRDAKAGDVREIEVDYPRSFPDASVAGKSVRFHVEVSAVKRKRVPALDDSLAMTVGSEPTLDALRARVRRDLEAARQKEAVSATRQKVLDVLIERQHFPVPEVLVNERVGMKFRLIANQMHAQGIAMDKTNIDWEQLRDELRPAAEKEVRGSLILDRVAEAEKLEVSEEELDDAIREAASEAHETPATLKTRLTQSDGLARLHSSRLREKALDHIVRNARVAHQLRLV
jgi:trigger factor